MLIIENVTLLKNVGITTKNKNSRNKHKGKQNKNKEDKNTYCNFADSLVNDYKSESEVESNSLVVSKNKQNNGRPKK